MKKTFTVLFLSLIVSSVHSQITSRLYFGDYPFFYRALDSNLISENIHRNTITKVEIKGSLWSQSKIYWVKTFDSNGFLIKERAKPTRLKYKLLAPWFWVTKPIRRSYTIPEISEIDSTNTGQINYIKYSGIKESYLYDDNGKLINIFIDYNGRISTAPRIKEIKLDYDSQNNLILEKVIWLAGDSTITRHHYNGNKISKSVVIRYYFENIQLSKTEYTWRLVEKPLIEEFDYIYLTTGLLDEIKIINKNDNIARQIKFKYK